MPPLLPLSVLDLAPITLGSTRGRRPPQQPRPRPARRAPRLPAPLGRRAPQHAGRSRARRRRSSSATSPAGTSTIRVGAGGIMLPNHSPLVIAEQFGTLESLYPGRIDLGLGRAPGTDQLTARALRRDPLERRPVPARRAGPAAALRAGAARRRRSRPSPARASRSRSGSSARAPTAPASPRCSACPTRSPRTSRPPTCWPRSSSTGASSGPRRSSPSPTRWPG